MKKITFLKNNLAGKMALEAKEAYETKNPFKAIVILKGLGLLDEVNLTAAQYLVFKDRDDEITVLYKKEVPKMENLFCKIKQVRNIKPFENLREILGDKIGSLLYEILDEVESKF